MTTTTRRKRLIRIHPHGENLHELADAAWAELNMTDGTYAEVARKTGLAPQTVANFSRGQTRYPRMQTVCTILDYFGWRLQAVRKS